MAETLAYLLHIPSGEPARSLKFSIGSVAFQLDGEASTRTDVIREWNAVVIRALRSVLGYRRLNSISAQHNQRRWLFRALHASTVASE